MKIIRFTWTIASQQPSMFLIAQILIRYKYNAIFTPKQRVTRNKNAFQKRLKKVFNEIPSKYGLIMPIHVDITDIILVKFRPHFHFWQLKNCRFQKSAFYECANRYIKCADFFYECAEKRLSNARLNCAEINCFHVYFKVYQLYLAIKTEVMIARFNHSSSTVLPVASVEFNVPAHQREVEVRVQHQFYNYNHCVTSFSFHC